MNKGPHEHQSDFFRPPSSHPLPPPTQVPPKRVVTDLPNASAMIPTGPKTILTPGQKRWPAAGHEMWAFWGRGGGIEITLVHVGALVHDTSME